MSGQVYMVDNMHVIAATEKLARFKVQQNLQIQIDIDIPSSECSTLTSTSREDEPPTPTSCRPEDDTMGDDEPCEKKKRRRRTAAQIDRKYICTYAGCKKAYGTEGSLTQHMRLKHRSMTLSHRDRVVSTFYPTNMNNIAIRPAINFMVDFSPPSSCFIGNESDVSAFGLEKLRLRSNSMPSDGYTASNQQCETPQWARKKTTPQSARAFKPKTTTPRQLSKAKIKRSQSMTSPQLTFHTTEPLAGYLTPPDTIDSLKLPPNFSYENSNEPCHTSSYTFGKDFSMLNSLNWDCMKEERHDPTDMSVLQALVENEPAVSASPEVSSTPTSPPLYPEFPIEDTDMLTNQYQNDMYKPPQTQPWDPTTFDMFTFPTTSDALLTATQTYVDLNI